MPSHHITMSALKHFESHLEIYKHNRCEHVKYVKKEKMNFKKQPKQTIVKKEKKNIKNS